MAATSDRHTARLVFQSASVLIAKPVPYSLGCSLSLGCIDHQVLCSGVRATGKGYHGSISRVERQIMSLNIKNPETYHLVQELAALTGETQTAAVTIAVRERLDRVRHLREAGLADRLLAIGADTAPRLHEPWRSADHGDLLYDEHGLPA